jgi:iron complex outermembrane receptor protein
MVGKGISRKAFAIATFAAASFVAPIFVWADTATATETSQTGGLEEILVTARKTKEELQTTPVAVTALSEATLQQKQLFEVVDLSHAVPNMSTGTTGPGPSSEAYLSIRGEAQNNANSASDQAVGTYVDGVYLARALVGNLGFLDVANIEVARGPQGTLFGRNTTGGALSVTSNQPTGLLEGNIEAGTGNYGQAYAEGVLNVPLIGDELGVRVAARYASHNAYFSDPFLTTGVDELKHDDVGRVTIRWAPSSMPLVLSIAADRIDERDTGAPEALLGYNATYLNNLIPSPFGGFLPLATLIPIATGYNPTNYLVNSSNFWHTYQDAKTPLAQINTPFAFNHAQGLAMNLDVDFGALHVKSITGYRESDTSNAEDLDGTPVNLIGFYSRYLQHQFSQELQFSGKVDKFDLIGGLYYFTEGGTEESESQSFQVADDVFSFLLHEPLPPAAVDQDLASFYAKSRAAFFQTNYHITDTIRATAGYRYTWDDRSIDRVGRNDILNTDVCAVGVNSGLPAPAPCSDPHSATFSYPAYTFGLDWEVLPDTFLYIKTSRASLAGGFNTRPILGTLAGGFLPETNKDVEVGFKNEALDRHLRTNLAFFYSKQTDLQNNVNTAIQTSTGPRISQYVINAGDAHKYGVELEVVYIPVQNLELQASAGYLHAAYVAGTFFETQQLPNGTLVQADRSGEPIPQAPEYTFSLGATETVPVSFGKFAFHVDYAYRASIYYQYDTPSPLLPAATIAQYNYANMLERLPGYGLVNARITLQLNQPSLEFAIWGRNLGDKQYFNYEFNSYTGIGTSVGYQADPRTFGVTANYKF